MENDSHARSSTTCRAGANRARYDALYLQELVQALRQRQRQRKKRRTRDYSSRDWKSVMTEKTAYERLEGQVRGSRGNEVRGRNPVEKKTCGGALLGKVTCMWEDGVCLGVKATTGEFIAEREVRHVAHETASRKLVTERRTRDNLGVVIGVLWRKNDDDPKVDGDSLMGEVVVTENRTEEYTWRKRRVRSSADESVTRENLEHAGLAGWCPGCASVPRGSARQAHTEKFWRGTVKAEAAKMRTKYCLDRAAERRPKRTK